MTSTPARRPNRVLGGADSEFWEYCEHDELRMQRCEECQELAWPPVASCESCGATRFDWERLSGEGSVISWCTFERSYYKELPVPWDTVLVELAEGPLFISNPMSFSNADIRQGMRVTVTFVDCEDDAGPFRLPVFELAG